MRTPAGRVRLKYVCEGGGEYGVNIAASEYVDEGIRLIRTSDLSGGKLATEEGAIFVPAEAVSSDDLLQSDDLLLSRSGTVGRAFLVPADADGMTFAGFLVRFRMRSDVVPRFVFYCTQSAEFQSSVQAEAIASTIQNFNAERYNNLAIPIPSAREQQAIADYLDRETARIDTLIEEQQRLIEMLRERRNAVVNRAIRRGVVNARMNDSGDPLIGDIPDGWSVVPIRRVAISLDSRRIPLSAEERAERSGPFPYYGATSVIDHVDDFIFDEPLVLVACHATSVG